MPKPGGNTVPDITQREHIGVDDTGDNIEAKRVANYIWNSGTEEWERQTASGGGGGGGTQYAEDAAHSSGDIGTMALGVRKDTVGSFASADGDYTPMQFDDQGRLRVTTSGGASGGASEVDDAAFTIASDSGNPIMGIYQSTEDSVDDGDVGVLGMTADRHLKVVQQGAITANLSATDNAVLDSIDTAVNGTLTVDGSGVTQPISASSLPLPTGAATSANQSTIIGHVDGIESTLSAIDAGKLEETTFTGRIGNVSATPTANTVLGRLKDIDDALSGTLTVDASGTAVPVTDNGSSLTVDGTVTAILSATDNAVLDNIDSNTDYGAVTGGGTETGALRVTIANNSTGVVSVDDNGASLTVDGTVSAQQSGTWSTRLQDGSGNNITSTSNALDVNIASGSSAGTEYTEGDTDASITGTAIMWEDSADTLRAVSASKPLPVDLGANNDVTVSGTVTANLSATDNTVLDNIDSNTDYGAVTGGGTETGALRVTIANNSTGVLSIDDNGGSLTVDGTVAATQSGTWNVGTVTTITNDVNIADGGNSITVDASSLDIRALTNADVVTAELSATDNAVLDQIEVNTSLGTTSAVTSVAGSASSVQLLASNTDRKEAVITNDSTADLYVKLGTTASTTSYTVKLRQDETFITNTYNGRIDGIWSSATGNARITEID